MKLIVILPLTLPKISNAIIRWGQSMLSWLPTDGQVIFVLAIFPVIMNVFQFCVMDQVIKAGKNEPKERRGTSSDDGDEEMDMEYQEVPTAEVEPGHSTPRRRNSSLRDLTKAVSRSSSVTSTPLLSAADDHRLVTEGSSRSTSIPGFIDNVWASLRQPNNSKGASEVLFSRDAEQEELLASPDDIAMSRLSLDTDLRSGEGDSRRPNSLGLSTS